MIGEKRRDGPSPRRAPSPLLDEATLTELVGRFYARVRRDDLLGPVFAAAIGDWNAHLHKLVAFWDTVINGTGRYRGSPMAAHAAHAGAITPAMFDRWLALWDDTTARVLDAERAALLQARARTMATAIARAL